ncbi:Lcl domain-containing protein [Barnesiella intestinihominis]|uniref:Lcl domain-containing protein n=1 Tax=Barnesiella intestinihominis TaxID=487174 RepID=UPI003F7C8B52
MDTAIHGAVVMNGEPVNAAAILLTPGGGTKITGSDGMYDFSGLEPGRYELKVFKEGCQSFNKSIDLVAGKNELLAITLSASIGNLSVNKAFIDMGSNESNNLAGFTVKNSGTAELKWTVTNAAPWITKIDPSESVVPAGGAEAVSFTIDRSKLSRTTTDNYASLIVKSMTVGDGSIAELLVTVFGSGGGTNTSNDNSDLDYVMVGDLYVQTKDISENVLDWESANRLCENSIVGDFDDWRLPTIEELATVYGYKSVVGGFKEDRYWSATMPYDKLCYSLDFVTGEQEYYLLSNKFNSRAVRKNVSPVVEILPVSGVSEMSVTLNGRIDNAGSPAYAERGFVYSTSHLPTVEGNKVVSYTAKNSAEFSAVVSGLVMGNIYYIRAYVVSKTGVFYSEELTVTVTDQLAMVTTLPVTDIDKTIAVLHGNIESKGIPAYTERGFVYSSTFKNPTVDDDKKVVSGTGTGEFSANLSGLMEGTTYYVRAYATNSAGTAYGQSVAFKAESPDYMILPDAGIMVQKADISESLLSWVSCNTLCENSVVGGFSDWRLPTREELALLYSEQDNIGKFQDERYWSATLDSDYTYSGYKYYYMDFKTGSLGSMYYEEQGGYNYRACARAVRTLL